MGRVPNESRRGYTAISTVGVTPRPYQAKALADLKYLPSIGLFFGTGTGKTLTSLLRVEQNPTKNLLVICAEKVIEQWIDVIEKNTVGAKVANLKSNWNSAKKDEFLAEHLAEFNVVVINFDIVHLLSRFPRTINDSWTVIVDESHRIKAMGPKTKNQKGKDGVVVRVDGRTKVTQAVLAIGERTPWKIILTATPTQGRYGGYIELYTQLKFLDYVDLDYEAFKERYVIEKKLAVPGIRFPVPVIMGYKHTEELDSILSLCCRYYEAKFGDFEPQHIDVFVDKAPHYAYMERERVLGDISLTNAPRMRTAQKMLTTGVVSSFNLYNERVVVVDNDIKIKWLEEFLQDTNEVVAVYYQYKVELEQLKALMKKLGKRIIVINGETKNAYRDINEKEYDVVLGQYQAASEALDGLHRKCHIQIYFAMPEDSVLYRQSLGRIYRDGQTKVPIYYYLMMRKTIDEDIRKMILEKVEFSQRTLGLIEVDA